MREIASGIRDGLRAVAVGPGLQLMDALMGAAVIARAGPRGAFDPDRVAVSWRTRPTNGAPQPVGMGTNARRAVGAPLPGGPGAGRPAGPRRGGGHVEVGGRAGSSE